MKAFHLVASIIFLIMGIVGIIFADVGPSSSGYTEEKGFNLAFGLVMIGLSIWGFLTYP